MTVEETSAKHNRPTRTGPGHTIDEGRFTPEEPLGEGRFAVVYRAQDACLQQPIALKLLREEHINGDPKWREAFDIEVDLLQKMADVPTVVTMIDHGLVSEGRPFISLELLPAGADLLSRVTHQGGFSEAEGLPIAWQLADVLRTAHARNIAYRDLKLEHIWWSDGRMTLIDWNVSRQLTTAGTDDGDFEALWEKEFSFRGDLFKLGTILYSLFTGLDIRDRQVPTPVYSQLKASGFSLTDEGIVWPIDFVGVPLSPELKDITRRLVHIDLDQRYQTAAEVCEALEDRARRLEIALVRPTKLPIKHPSATPDHPLPGAVTSAALSPFGAEAPSGREAAGLSPPKGLLTRLYRAVARGKETKHD